MRWDADSLKELPTLHAGQCCSCKVDTGDVRVWVCRVAGGVTVEQYNQRLGRWETVAGGCTEEVAHAESED
jgi:hypothetical protein